MGLLIFFVRDENRCINKNIQLLMESPILEIQFETFVSRQSQAV